jgi:nicotinate-nucleotide pyrophosphorylase (carboxylating)
MRAASQQLLHRLAWADLDPAYLRRLVAMARDEDLAGLGLRVKPHRTGDRSTAVLPGSARTASADLVARTTLIACGLPLLPLILAAYGGASTKQNWRSNIKNPVFARVRVQLRARDGRAVPAGGVLATLTGDPRTLLAAERVMLNFLQRLSGIATYTARHVAALGPGHTRLLDTRKTTPGHRMLEKYAVACGGGWNHRLGLFDRVMFKDNHLAVLGFETHGTPNLQRSTANAQRSTAHASHDANVAETQQGTLKIEHPSALAAAVARAKKSGPVRPVEVEVDSITQISSVLAAGADVILLDNFSPAQIRRAVALIAGQALVEASGGITLKSISRYADLGLDFVSTGALVHHSSWADIGLDWRA